MTVPNTLVTTYLEMRDRSEFRPAYLSNADFVCMQMMQPDVEFYRFLYRSVGEAWRWRDRLVLSGDELKAVLADVGTSVHVLYDVGVPAGYIELDRRGTDTEIVYFGLRPEFMGRGLGKHLLSLGVARAWEDGANRVWVHTCNLDGPFALANYMARGFRVYDVKEEPMPRRYL